MLITVHKQYEVPDGMTCEGCDYIDKASYEAACKVFGGKLGKEIAMEGDKYFPCTGCVEARYGN